MPKKLLFFTCAEHGQANVHIAVLTELQRTYLDAELHLASSSDLAKRCPTGVTFHALNCDSMIQRWAKHPGVYPLLAYPSSNLGGNRTDREVGVAHTAESSLRDAMFGVSFWEVIKSIRYMTGLILESPSDYLHHINECLRIVEVVNPDFIVIDTLESAARDAVTKLGREWVLLSPNTLKDLGMKAQKIGVFRIPLIGSGLPYPVPWYYLPLNVFFLFFIDFYLKYLDSRVRGVEKARHEAGYPGRMPTFDADRPVPVLCMSTPAVEYPMEIPEDIICCGPIVQAPKPIHESDPELYHWVMIRPTILVVLGSHVNLDQKGADELWKGAKTVLDARDDVQLLWKLQPHGEVIPPHTEAYGDRVRIVSWLTPNPIDVLATGNIVASVNHGGSNSYHEALSAGIPQVILSPWFDCHDFGVKAEWLGIGKWANRYSAPEVEGREFGKALRTVVGETWDSTEARAMRVRAHKCLWAVQLQHGPKAGKDGPNGRQFAAREIWRMANNQL